MALLASLVPLAVLTYFTIHLAEQAVVDEVEARVQTTAAVTSLLIQEQMEGIADLTASYASRQRLIMALGKGDPAAYDESTILGQLTQLQGTQTGISGAFLADLDCRLTQVVPATPEIVGVDFSFRDWCRGVRATGKPYVSEAYRTAIAGQPLVVAVATMVRPLETTGPDGAVAGRPIGILAVTYRLDAIRALATELGEAQGVRLLLTDQRGSVLVGPGSNRVGEVRSGADDPRVRAALDDRSGTVRGDMGDGTVLSAYQPVEGLGWALSADVAERQALAGVARLRSTALGVAGALALVLMLGIAAMARQARLRREAQERLVEREAHTRLILEAATDAFLSMEADGRISAWNRQAEQLYGWTEAEARGRRLFDLVIPATDRQGFEDDLNRFLVTGASRIVDARRIELTALHRDGREFPVEMAIWPVRSQGAVTFNAFVHDIAERKRAEAELASARDQALEASNMKSEFLATMSHEIRTPMNGVIGLTGLLLDSDLSEVQRHHAEGVRASGEALLGIINDILDFSKIEAGKLELEAVDFDLVEAVEGVAALVTESARAKALDLIAYCDPDVPTALRGDVGRLGQILLNFSSNAVKFTDAGEVVLRATLAEPPDGDRVVVRFEVTDTGVGIDPDGIERLFDPFSQADASTTRRYGGTGLGLAICRRLADAMGGDIGVDSQPGAGSTFWLVLPLGRAQRPVAPRVSTVDGLERLRVLVVDDNQTNREVLDAQLRAWGLEPDLAEGAQEALTLLRAAADSPTPYGLALLDMAMPDMDGLELARTVSSDPVLRSTRLVLLSSVSVEAAAATEAGIEARITKPVRLSALYDALVGPAPVATGRSEVSTPPRSSPVAPPGGRGTVLVVEDHVINQEVARGILSKLGFGSDVAGNGLEALAALERRRYDAVLMDCHMPEMDGYQATAAIRRRETEAGLDRVPVIAMTAGASDDDRDRCLAAGMDDYLSKPVKERDLATALGRWAPGRSPARPSASGLPSPDDVLDAGQIAALVELAAATGDPAFLRELIEDYVERSGALLTELRASSERGDAGGVLSAAHALKGTSATLGASAVAAVCETIDRASGEGAVPDGDQLARLSHELDRAAAALRVYTATS